jgi:hypothetical protein
MKPQRGDRFSVAGRHETLTVEVMEVAFTAADAPPRYLVRTAIGTRRLLVPRDPPLDGVAFVGTPLPADPAAPQP